MVQIHLPYKNKIYDFRIRSYNRYMIDKETWNIRTDHNKMGKLFKYSMPVQYKKCIYIYIVLTYNPNFNNWSFLIRKNLQFFYADPETKRVFMPAPFVSFRSARNLKSFLVRSKVYPLERKVGSTKCNGKCC